MPTLTPEARDKEEQHLDSLPVGAVYHVEFDEHYFVFIKTRLDGMHTGRARYTVACETCEKLMHSATTGPLSNVERHFNDLRRDRVYRDERDTTKSDLRIVSQFAAQEIKDRDEKIAALRACIVYARDRRSGSFDFDEWRRMVDKALDGTLPSHAVEDAQAKEAQAWAAVTAIRKDRDALKAAMREQADRYEELRNDRDLWKRRATVEWSKGPYAVSEGVDPGSVRVTARNLADENHDLKTELDATRYQLVTCREENQALVEMESMANGQAAMLSAKLARVEEERIQDLHVMGRQGKVIEELREKLRVVIEAVRDDARRASQRYLDERRALEEKGGSVQLARMNTSTVNICDSGKPWARPGLSSEQIRDAIIAEVGMMADARTPEMKACYEAALKREGKVDSPTGPVSKE